MEELTPQIQLFEFFSTGWTPEEKESWQLVRNTDIFVSLVTKSIQIIISIALLIYLAYVTLKDRQLRVQHTVLAILSLTSGIFGLLRIYALIQLNG